MLSESESELGAAKSCDLWPDEECVLSLSPRRALDVSSLGICILSIGYQKARTPGKTM